MASKAEISRLCVAALAEILHRPEHEIDPHAPFARLGLDSAMAVYLIVELEERLGIELSPEAIYDHPSVEALSEHIARLGAPPAGGPGARR